MVLDSAIVYNNQGDFMSFQVTFNEGFEKDDYELIEKEEGQTPCYTFQSSKALIKVRILSENSIAFQRKTPEMEIKGILHLNQLTHLNIKVPDYENQIVLDAFLKRLVVNYPQEISFVYQIVDQGRDVEEPREIMITEKI